MHDLTPELLAQLDLDVSVGFPGSFAAEVGDDADRLLYVDGDAEHEIIAEMEVDDVVEPLARMLNAIPALVAAAKERDQLRSEMGKLAEKSIAYLQSSRMAIDSLRAQLAQPPIADLEPFCDGCGQEIDPDTCHCGSSMEGGREYHGHDAVPMGCRCLYDKTDWAAVAKGLRARLREERAARRGLAPATPTEEQPISAAEELPR